MPLVYIGQANRKKIFITSYCQKRLRQRNLSPKEVLQILSKRDVSYPVDEDGRQKIRSTIGSGKKAFLTILEDGKKIIIITGGEA
jgi:hypothetical protein